MRWSGKRIEAKEAREADVAGCGVTWKAASGTQSSEAEIGPSGGSAVGVNRKDSLETRNARANGEVVQETCRSVGQSWDCAQLEDELEERDVMGWLEDDEMRRKWEEVSKDEEKITSRRNEGRGLSGERVQHVPEVMVSQAQVKKKETKEEEEKKKAG